MAEDRDTLPQMPEPEVQAQQFDLSAFGADEPVMSENLYTELQVLAHREEYAAAKVAQAVAQLHVACSRANVAELLAELDGERNRSQMFADLVRGVAVALHGDGWSDTSRLPEEVASLRAEVEALRADGERLDYIASNARCDPKMDGQHVWWPTSFNHRLVGPNLRAAIDAAKGGAA